MADTSRTSPESKGHVVTPPSSTPDTADTADTPDEIILDTEALSVARALGGKISGLSLLQADVASNGGEHRPQQEEMARAVTAAIDGQHPLLVQAGTGTGKSRAYVYPLAASGKRGVICTVTNQLSEQLIRYELPHAQATLAAVGQEMTFALLKGRNNYVCLAKTAELESLNAQAEAHGGSADGDGVTAAPNTDDRLFELDPAEEAPAATGGASTLAKRRQMKADGAQVGELLRWVKTTKTGDRSDATEVPDRAWAQVSTSAADCPGASSCPFGEKCFTEQARIRARKANIVVTNHALFAQDIRSGTLGRLSGGAQNQATAAGVFGKHDVVIVDEAHALPDSLTSALSSEIDPRSMGKFISKAAKYIHDPDITADGESRVVASIRKDLEAFEDALGSLPTGAITALPDGVVVLLNALVTRFLMVSRLLVEAAVDATGAAKHKRASATNVLVTQCELLIITLIAARTSSDGSVRWVDQRRPEDCPVLRTAPLEVGDVLTAALDERTLIVTSATLAVANNFNPIKNALGLTAPDVKTLDVGSPFNYPTQGMLYIPKAPFPEPAGRDRSAHTAAVLDEIVTLVTAAGGRTLALFTSTDAAVNAAAHLRTHLPHLAVHAHGEAPADVLVRRFTDDETSVLCATMGLWQGTNVEGPSCSLVIMDKIAFTPPDDVLTAARRAHVDEQGRNGFSEVLVFKAAIAGGQGAGRLIRNKTDRGVVAILDPRLHTKSYGRTLLASMPNFNIFTDQDKVVGALTRLTGGTTPEHIAAGKAASPAKTAALPAVKGRAPLRASSTRGMAKTTKPRPHKIL